MQARLVDVYDYILGQKAVVPNEEWQRTRGREWNKKPVKYW